MAKRIGKYKVGKGDVELSLRDGGRVVKSLTMASTGSTATFTGNVTFASHKHKKLVQVAWGAGSNGESLTAAQSGQVMICAPTHATNDVATLPTPAAGLHYKFITDDTDSNNVDITFTSNGSSAADIGIGVFDVGGAAYSGLNKDRLKMGDSSTNHQEGDWVECWCDGTNWWCTGVATVASSITLA